MITLAKTDWLGHGTRHDGLTTLGKLLQPRMSKAEVALAFVHAVRRFGDGHEQRGRDHHAQEEVRYRAANRVRPQCLQQPSAQDHR